MTEEAPLNLPADIASFIVPSVPQWYDFSHTETPEEIAAREAFFTTGPTRLYEQENLAPIVPAPVAPAPQFKAPAPPSPRPASTSSSETNTGVPADEDIEGPNLGQLAAFRGPRPALRRSTQQQQQPTANAPATSAAAARTTPQQPRSLTAGAAAAARAAERRRSASLTRNTEDRRRSGANGGSATTAAPTTTASQQPPRVPPPRIRASSLERTATSRTQSTSSTLSSSGGVQTRAMAAAAAASAADGVTPANEDASVAALSAGVARLAVAAQRQSRQPNVVPRRVPASNTSTSSAQGGAVRVAASSSAVPPSRAAATRGSAPIRVGAPLRAADRALAAAGSTTRLTRPTGPTGPTGSAAGGATPRGGGGVATATGSATRPQSGVRHKPTPESLSRLAAPRNRSNIGAPGTPIRRPFGSGLRNYAKDNAPPGTVTIPDTPHFRVDRRASATSRASASDAVVDPSGPASAPRPPVNVSRLVARLSAPRPQRVTSSNENGGSALPPAQPRRLNAVPLGRTHGMPVVRRTTTNTNTAAVRSRSNSAARAAAAAGGVVQGAGELRTAPTGEEQEE